jgi:hypothetical protein
MQAKLSNEISLKCATPMKFIKEQMPGTKNIYLVNPYTIFRRK